jgi:hypothetical protein
MFGYVFALSPLSDDAIDPTFSAGGTSVPPNAPLFIYSIGEQKAKVNRKK